MFAYLDAVKTARIPGRHYEGRYRQKVGGRNIRSLHQRNDHSDERNQWGNSHDLNERFQAHSGLREVTVPRKGNHGAGLVPGFDRLEFGVTVSRNRV